jgi:hypothetical protein
VSFQDGKLMGLNGLDQRRKEVDKKVADLQTQIEDLTKLVHTLLTVICEEADGVQSGSVPTIPGQPARGYCM